MHAAKFPVWCLDVLQATSLIIHYILLLYCIIIDVRFTTGDSRSTLAKIK